MFKSRRVGFLQEKKNGLFMLRVISVDGQRYADVPVTDTMMNHRAGMAMALRDARFTLHQLKIEGRL